MGASLATLRVLRAFLDNPGATNYGLALIAASGINGGALYPILSRLERDGWIQGEWEDLDETTAGRRRRRYYRLTAAGERDAREFLSRTVEQLSPPALGRRAKSRSTKRGAWAPS
jgi:PadR family transcriptional regulator, regulatory protein PadR